MVLSFNSPKPTKGLDALTIIMKVKVMNDEPTKNELIDVLEDAKEYFNIKRRECKDLHKELKALKQAFEELNASHKRLEKAYEKLGKTHKKLKKAHSSLLNE
jgi:phage shock protein A